MSFITFVRHMRNIAYYHITISMTIWNLWPHRRWSIRGFSEVIKCQDICMLSFLPLQGDKCHAALENINEMKWRDDDELFRHFAPLPMLHLYLRDCQSNEIFYDDSFAYMLGHYVDIAWFAKMICHVFVYFTRFEEKCIWRYRQAIWCWGIFHWRFSHETT